MTKRRVERDLDDLEDEVLGDLTPEERLQLWLEAAAAENEVWLEQLRDTAPIIDYYSTDLAFAERGRAALKLLDQAMYDLHTTYLQYELVAQHQRLMASINILRDDELTDEEREQLEEMEGRLHSLFAELYAYYHGYQRFATETLGVSFATWTALHPDGDVVLERVEEVLDDGFAVERAEEWLNDEVDTEGDDPDDEEWLSLDAGVEPKYRACVGTWEEMEERIP